LATVLQIEDFWGADKNPYYHAPGDTMAHMNLDYWEEQIKATLVTAAHLAVPVPSGNTAPLADDQAVSTGEDSAVGITLTATDADGDPLTYAVVDLPAHAVLSGTAPHLTYTPDADYHGPDSFTFRANDGLAYSNIATVSITVNSVNDAPLAEDQTVSAFQDRAVAFTLTASDVDGDPLTYTVVSSPTHGTLSGTPPGLIYTPPPGYLGTDGFTFQANDGLADSNTATVTITVYLRFDLYLPLICRVAGVIADFRRTDIGIILAWTRGATNRLAGSQLTRSCQ
jgi:hypothetical protein